LRDTIRVSPEQMGPHIVMYECITQPDRVPGRTCF